MKVEKNISEQILRKLRLSLFRYKRRFQTYCVGTAKSGTNSIAAIFQNHYRTAHEPEDELLLSIILAKIDNLINADKMALLVHKRDRRMMLELDSSSLNYWILNTLVKEFDNAKFILTIRDCYSWLDSFLNHLLTYPASKNWMRLRELRFNPDKHHHDNQEQILLKYGLYTIEAYLSYWTKHNKDVLEIVPEDRLLIIRTQDISFEIDKIADFLDIPADKLDISKSHSFKGKKKYNLLNKIDKVFIEEKVNKYCKELMEKFFSDI